MPHLSGNQPLQCLFGFPREQINKLPKNQYSIELFMVKIEQVISLVDWINYLIIRDIGGDGHGN